MIKSALNKYNLIVSQFRTLAVKKKRSSKWSSLQKDFLQSHPVCEICGTNKHLQVHHKKPFHLYPELELEESNLVTLCMDKKECHLRIAHGSSWRYYVPRIGEFIEILKKDLSKFKKIAEESKETRLESSED
jgi:hypothetical protein